MPTWLEEFLIITGVSRRLQIALFAIPVVPSLVMLFGAFQMKIGRDVTGSLMPLVASLSKSLLYLYWVIALITCISCIRIAAKEYRRIHRHLFGGQLTDR